MAAYQALKSLSCHLPDVITHSFRRNHISMHPLSTICLTPPVDTPAKNLSPLLHFKPIPNPNLVHECPSYIPFRQDCVAYHLNTHQKIWFPFLPLTRITCRQLNFYSHLIPSGFTGQCLSTCIVPIATQGSQFQLGNVHSTDILQGWVEILELLETVHPVKFAGRIMISD